MNKEFNVRTSVINNFITQVDNKSRLKALLIELLFSGV
jgi:hypothetical protein